MGKYHSMSPSTLPAHDRSSQTVPKTRPKIKIIHIIAPEIIKIDAANFRELVQRLTGSAATAAAAAAGTMAVDVAPPRTAVEERKEEEAAAADNKRPAPAMAAEWARDFVVRHEEKSKKIKCEVKVEEGGFGGGLDHGELWMDLNPGGFLSFLEDDVFHGMSPPDFLQPLGSSRRDLVGEMCASYLA